MRRSCTRRSRRTWRSGRTTRACAAEETARRVEEMLVRYGLAGHRDHPAHLLSGGQKQLLAIAGVLVMHPQRIVFDEPTTLLDLPNTRRVSRVIDDARAGRRRRHPPPRPARRLRPRPGVRGRPAGRGRLAGRDGALVRREGRLMLSLYVPGTSPVHRAPAGLKLARAGRARGGAVRDRTPRTGRRRARARARGGAASGAAAVAGRSPHRCDRCGSGWSRCSASTCW